MGDPTDGQPAPDAVAAPGGAAGAGGAAGPHADPHAGLVLRRAGRDDEADLLALNAEAFEANPKARADMAAWQWWDNPFGETLIWVWHDGQRVIAQYVAYCVPGVLDGRPATLTCGVDAAVAPAYQGRRLFSPLSRALYDDCNAHDRPLLAFPNAASIGGIRRAGWVEVARQRFCVLPLDDGFLAARLHLPTIMARAARAVAFRHGATAGLRADVVAGPPPGLAELWSEVAPTVRYGVARGAPWWDWRYDAHPDSPYQYLEVRSGGRLRAAAAARVREEMGGRFHCLLEFLAADAASAAALVRAIGEGALGPADGAVLETTPGSRLDRQAVVAGFRRLPVRFEPRAAYFGVVPHPELVPDPAAVPWSTAWGDLDSI